MEMSNTPSEKVQTFKTLDEWMEETLKKKQYDKYITEAPKLLYISKKTWQNWRLGNVVLTYPKKLALVSLFGKYGFTLETLNDD